MPKTTTKVNPLEPKQERSRESLRRITRAAAEVLAKHGLEGTTIPRIAEHAGLTPGAIYRRFEDKDALLEAVVLGIMERQDERTQAALKHDEIARLSLAELAEKVVTGMVIGYRANAPLLRALRQFVQSRTETPFWARAAALEVGAFEHAVELFLARRKEIAHPDPALAISTGMIMIVGALYEIVVMPGDPQPWRHLLPKDDAALAHELASAFLRYLGVVPPARKAPAKKRRIAH